MILVFELLLRTTYYIGSQTIYDVYITISMLNETYYLTSSRTDRLSEYLNLYLLYLRLKNVKREFNACNFINIIVIV